MKRLMTTEGIDKNLIFFFRKSKTDIEGLHDSFFLIEWSDFLKHKVVQQNAFSDRGGVIRSSDRKNVTSLCISNVVMYDN